MLAIQEQLNTTRKYLLSVLEGLSDIQLNWKPDEHTWNVAQIVQHIATVEVGAAKIIQLGLAQKPNFVPRDIPLGLNHQKFHFQAHQVLPASQCIQVNYLTQKNH